MATFRTIFCRIAVVPHEINQLKMKDEIL